MKTIYVSKGEQVTCRNGHAMCTVAEDMYCGNVIKASTFTDWKIPEPHPKAGDVLAVYCDKCNASCFEFFPMEGNSWFGPRLHIDGILRLVENDPIDRFV